MNKVYCYCYIMHYITRLLWTFRSLTHKTFWTPPLSLSSNVKGQTWQISHYPPTDVNHSSDRCQSIAFSRLVYIHVSSELFSKPANVWLFSMTWDVKLLPTPAELFISLGLSRPWKWKTFPPNFQDCRDPEWMSVQPATEVNMVLNVHKNHKAY